VDGTGAYASWDDRIVAEFGDGYDVEGIAARYGLTVEQVYAVVARSVGPADRGTPHGIWGDEAVVADYAEGYDVDAISRKHGISVEQVYEVVQRAVD
jgi:Mor family transcriptional regulator